MGSTASELIDVAGGGSAGTRVALPLPGAWRSAFQAIGAAVFVFGLVAVLCRDHPVVAALAWSAAGLVAVVVAARLSRAAIVFDTEQLTVRSVLLTATYRKDEILHAEVASPQWSVSGPWWSFIRGWQDCELVLADNSRVPIARSPAGERGHRPELDRLVRTINTWLE